MSTQVPKFGLAIDWETSGYSWPDYAKHHQGISFGAIIFDVNTLEPVDSLYQEVKFKPAKYKWEFTAERIHGLSQKHLEENGVSQEKAAEDLCNLIVQYIGTTDVLLMGHRVYFDRAFTDQLTKTVGIELAYHPTTIDSASMATALIGISKSEEVFQLLGLPPRSAHNAFEDILYTLESVKRMKEIFVNGLMKELNDHNTDR